MRVQGSKTTIQDVPKARRYLLESVQGQMCGQSSISPRPNVSSKLDRLVIRSRGGFIWPNHICSQCVLGISQGWPTVHHKWLGQTKILKLQHNLKCLFSSNSFLYHKIEWGLGCGALKWQGIEPQKYHKSGSCDECDTVLEFNSLYDPVTAVNSSLGWKIIYVYWPKYQLLYDFGKFGKKKASWITFIS